MDIKEFKEIRIVHECQIGRPEEKPQQPNNKTVKKVYIDGVYVGTCKELMVEFKEVYI